MLARNLMLSSLLVLVFSLAASPGLAQSPAPLGRTLEWTVEINAPISKVWEMWTTEEGIKTWMTPVAEVDLRVGGTIRTNYNPSGTIGDEGTIVHRILSLEPGRMISMRTEKSPAGFPHARAIEQAWGITYFDPIDEHRTRVRLVSAGWGSGPEWDAAETFFQAGNEWTLNKLKALFPEDEKRAAQTPPVESQSQAKETLARVRRLVGGEWIAQRQSPEGALFRVRNVCTNGPDGQSVITRGWLGGDEGMFEHASTQIWREPGSGEVRFQNINEQGHIARGTIVSAGDETIIWHWHARTDNGPGRHYRVTMTFTGPDAYDMKIEHIEEDGSFSTMIEMPFTRVESSPEAFHRPAPERADH